LTIICEILYSTKENINVVLKFEKNYFSKKLATTATKRLDAYFNELETIINILAKGYNNEKEEQLDNLGRPLLEGVKKIPHIMSLYIALNDGTFLQARTREGIRHLQNNKEKTLPPYVKYIMRRVQNSSNSSDLIEKWTYLNEDSGVTFEEKIARATSDFNKRDWYVKAELNKTLTWSDEYIFTLTKVPGVTVSKPLSYDETGNALGVIGLDCALSYIEPLLADIKISENARVYLINAKQEVLCSTMNNKVNVESSGGQALISAGSSEDLVLNSAVKSLFSTGGSHTTFEVEGIKYVSTTQKLSKFPISILLITPQSDFTDDFEKVKRDMFLISVAIFLIALCIVFILSKRISTPISRLSEYARAISGMEIDEELIEIKSNIYELRELANSMNAMHLSVATFSKYAPRALVRRLLIDNVQPVLGGKTTEISMMFTDIEKFSTVSENLPAEYLMLHLSEYFDELTKKIVENNGIIDKYVGDSIMAIWGAPDPDDNHVLNACNSALECSLIVEELREKWRPLGKPPLPTRFGLHVGQAIVGNIGSRDRMNFTAIGDSVNIASRLEGVNKIYGTKILVSESVESVAREHILFRVIDRVAVKGRAGGITIYEPLCSMKNAENENYYSFIGLSSKSKEAFELYQEKRYIHALKIYGEIADSFPDRVNAIIPLIKTCQDLIDNENLEWDGINRMISK
jgi:adenylate cyclase